MGNITIAIHAEILEIIEEGSCEACQRIGTIYESLIFHNDQSVGEVFCLCVRCSSVL
jgi:hypothetical protein